MAVRSFGSIYGFGNMLKSNIVSSCALSQMEIAVTTHTRRESIHLSVSSVSKRLLDVVGALVGSVLVLAVLMPIAIAIWLDNPGPIFYGQLRCGLNGKTFRMWKFRSMVVDADRLKHLVENEAKGAIFKNRNDPRVTRVGRFLRKTSLDELPQFWNVLRGEMSLVGTRPPTVDEVKTYTQEHFKRLLVKPGITGEWQVNGRSHIDDFEEIVKLDLAYQEKWSVVYDVKLVLQTVRAVVARSGAF